MNEKTLIIIPAFNEEDVIEETLKGLKEFQNHSPFYFDICVVNDGSSDQTAMIVSNIEDIILINLPTNLGIGGAVQTGYKYAYYNHYDIAIQFDADGQHLPNQIPILIKKIKEDSLNMVIGSRFKENTGYKGSVFRRTGIRYFEWLLNMLARTKVTDSTSGFRAIDKNVIQLFAFDYPKDYPEPEVIIQLSKFGMKSIEIPVKMIERQGGKSSITPIRSLYYMIKVSLSIFVQYLSKGGKK